MTFTLNKTKAEQLAKELLMAYNGRKLPDEEVFYTKIFTDSSFMLFLQYTTQDPVKSLFKLAQPI